MGSGRVEFKGYGVNVGSEKRSGLESKGLKGFSDIGVEVQDNEVS